MSPSEVAGQCVALLALPWRDVATSGGWTWNLALAATAFLAFRLFDILKPPPANGMQRWPAGRGILADDLVAGLYALIATQLIARLVLPEIMGPVG
ncbi:MAG: phosphatidylglycerophosphatase A [Planctomycetota bacterium]